MDERTLAVIVSIVINLPIVIGLLVGFYRYRKHKDSIKEELKKQYDDAQKKGGISSLYYKHPERRLFKRTFGLPILLGMAVYLLLLAVLYFFIEYKMPVVLSAALQKF